MQDATTKTAAPAKSSAAVQSHGPAARTAAKHLTTAGKPAAKAQAKAASVSAPKKTAKPVTAPKAATRPQGVSVKKDPRVSEEFSLLQSEKAALKELKKRAAKLLPGSKKSTVLRAAIKALAALPDAALATALQNLPAKK